MTASLGVGKSTCSNLHLSTQEWLATSSTLKYDITCSKVGERTAFLLKPSLEELQTNVPQTSACFSKGAGLRLKLVEGEHLFFQEPSSTENADERYEDTCTDRQLYGKRKTSLQVPKRPHMLEVCSHAVSQFRASPPFLPSEIPDANNQDSPRVRDAIQLQPSKTQGDPPGLTKKEGALCGPTPLSL